MGDTQRLGDRPVRRAAASGLAAVVERFGGPTPELAVLTYHRVAPAGSDPDLHPGLAASVEAFGEQMAWLARRGGAVGIDEVLAACTGGPRLRPGSVLVTFDDAYSCVAEHAWPILKRHGIPAVLFVPTAYPDGNRSFWWDSLHAALRGTSRASLELSCGTVDVASPAATAAAFKTLRAEVVARSHGEGMDLVDEILASAEVAEPAPAVLSWSDIERLAFEGLAMAPHSRTHSRLDRVPAWTLASEVSGSLSDLQVHVPDAALAFAYPGGGHGAAVRTAVADAGMMAGFTTERGVNPMASTEPLRLARINVGRGTSLAMIRAQLSTRTHALVRAAGRSGSSARTQSPSQPRSIQWS